MSLLEGPALVLGAGAGALAGYVTGASGRPVALLVSALGPGAVGVLDDLTGATGIKGLRGHLGALRSGRVTTGAVKIIGLAACGLIAADSVRDRTVSGPRRAADALLGGAVIAGSANLVNLLDLRPGRALKAVVLASAVLGARANRSLPAAVAGGTALGLLPDDLAGRTMLGDGGANPAGALVGTALVAQTGRRGRVATLAVLVAATLASEKVSFTRVIADTPILREIDAWGRE
ncbi:conserved exported hypothetical protein [Nostocoides jenkinsii Ben 74]|uniref:Uncharacterized protein n=1 Tax=Nostocoides jenkinsii Ben 74 TaxID=1193518 RepID=A0A077MC78_9MICO|nr:conserved exported hypothetical protein [Tetrasphaera jenkinsii Ben 74]